jgi:pimeloyl-ACP methyl ester carboxylesterase
MDRAAGFAKVARRLDDDHRVLRYDRRGYAESLPVGGPFTAERHGRDLLALLAGRPAVLVGHSYGGHPVLWVATHAPELVRAVVLFETPLPFLAWWPTSTAGAVVYGSDRTPPPEEAAEGFLRRMLGDAVWERLPERTRATRRAEGHALVGELGDARLGPSWDVDRVRVPVVVGRGGRGAEHHRRGTAWFVEHLPDARLVEIPDVGHAAHAAAPGPFSALVRLAADLAGSGVVSGP